MGRQVRVGTGREETGEEDAEAQPMSELDESEYPIPQWEDGRYMARGDLSWGVIGRESFAGFLGGAAFRHLRHEVARLLKEHALTDTLVGAGYPVCTCQSSVHDVEEHRRHVAEKILEMFSNL